MSLIFFSGEHRPVLKWTLSLISIPIYIAVDFWIKSHDAVFPLPEEYLSYVQLVNDLLVIGTIFFMFFVFTRETETNIETVKSQKRELSEALVQAEEATRSKSEFLANMSHEIRTPMNGIIGATELLDVSTLDAQQKDLVKIIAGSGNILLELINDILDLSKIEAGKLEINEHDFVLLDLIEDVVEQQRFLAADKDLELIYLVDDSLPMSLHGDSLRVSQILINLIGNAVKFTEKGQVFINVQHKRTDEEGRICIEFSIEDSGIGISPENLELIFESFTQEDGSTTRKFGGTGLGTTISRLLVELMGGSIRAQSPNPHVSDPDNPGSIFTFQIPFKGALAQYEREKSIDLQGLDCLVIDDNKTNLFVLNSLLSSWNANVTTVNSGLSALEVIEDLRPRLILLDYQMPKFNGMDFLKALKQRTYSFEYDTILLSSDITVSTKEIEAQALAFDCLMKPVRHRLLRNTIRRALEQRKEKQIQLETSSNPEVEYSAARILMVEDNTMNQAIATMLFKSLGYKIEVAVNGQDALEKVDAASYDLIFMDMQMPVLDGIEATVELRKRNVKTPIIALTANTMKGDKEHALDNGMDDYLSKPVRKAELQATLERWLAKA